MHNKVNISCDDIKKKLKAFLDDLLAEDEYKAFCYHINTCGNCEKYVRSIGSLSNQLWKLGKVKVPEDLGSTIMYKLTHPEEKAQPPKFVISKKYIIVGSILILLVGALFLATSYFKKQHAPNKDDVPIVKAEVIYKHTLPSDIEAQLQLKQLETIATNLGVSEKDSIQEKPPVKDEAVISKTGPLHWHFRYSEEMKNAGLEKEIRRVELSLQQERKKKDLLETEFENLQKDSGLELGQYYPGGFQKAVSEQKLQKNAELEKKLQELKEQDNKIKNLEGEKQRLEFQLRQGVEENKRKEAERKAKLLNALSVTGIEMEYQKNDILIFTATAEKIGHALEQILFISHNTPSFRDFTSSISTFADKESRVSIYLEDDGASSLHWHIGPIMQDKKANILEIIRELSNSIDYESDELLIFSIPNTELINLLIRIQAAGVTILKYGSEETKKDTLRSGRIVISVYFTK